jgi:hypothetical protein
MMMERQDDLSPEKIAMLHNDVKRIATEIIEQWNGLDALLAAGLLTKQSKGWYRVNDFKVIETIGRLVRSMETDKSGNLGRVQFLTPTRSLYAIAGIEYTPPKRTERAPQARRRSSRRRR